MRHHKRGNQCITNMLKNYYKSHRYPGLVPLPQKNINKKDQ